MTGSEEILFVEGKPGDDTATVRVLLGDPVTVHDRQPLPVRTRPDVLPDAAVVACRWVLADCDSDRLPVEVSLPDGTTVPSAYLREHQTGPRVRVVPMPGCVGIQCRRGLDTIGVPRWLPYPPDARDIDSSEFVTELSVAVRAAVQSLPPKENPL